MLDQILSKKKKKRKNVGDVFFMVGTDTPISSKNNEFVLDEDKKKWRIVIFSILIMFTAFILLSKSFVLQIVKGRENFKLAQGNSVKLLSIQAERGVIYDRNNAILVRNKPTFSLELNVELCRNSSLITACTEVIDKASSFIKIDRDTVLYEINSGISNIVLATNLTKSEILPLEANISNFPSLFILITPLRDYVYGPVLAHLVGYVSSGHEIIGKMGIEKSYDKYISGIKGSKVFQTDSTGRSLFVLHQTSPASGQSIKLFLDLELQKKSYELLKKIVDSGKAKGGSIVAQDPSTGGILTLVSYPSFDPNTLSEGISIKEFEKLRNDTRFPFFNRAISATYPPGSVFKLVMASGALTESVVSEYTTINDIGYIQVGLPAQAGKSTFRNWKQGGHGIVDMKKALQVSNDTYFYTVGGGYGDIRGLGIQKIAEWAKKFGYGKSTGIDIEGEVAGFVPDAKERKWYLGDTYITSIGQGDVLSTALQVNNITTYFANGGYIFKPRIVDQIGEMPKYSPQVVAKNLISEKDYELIRSGLNSAVEIGGTAYPLFDFSQKHPGIKLAGKTGPAETSNKDKTHAWFTVFGSYDAENKASIALTVFLEDGGSGADNAAPIARQLLDLWFK